MSHNFSPPNITSKSSTYAIRVTDSYLRLDATSGGFTATLPLISSVPLGAEYLIKRLDSTGNVLTIGTSGSDKIDTASSTTIGAAGVLRLIAGGAQRWDVW